MDKKITPKEFIKENHDLITVIGVFGALTALFVNINQIYLTFFSLLIFLLLCWELWLSFPKSEQATLRLTVFEAFFISFAGSLLAYILYYVHIEHKELIPIFNLFILASYLLVGVFLFDHFKFFNIVRGIAPENSKLSPITRALAFIVYLMIILILYWVTITLIQSGLIR